MLHTLILVKIKDRRTKHHFKPLFQVTFIDSHLSAEFFYGNWIANMFQQNGPGTDDFFPFLHVGKKFTGRHFIFSTGVHRLQTVKEQYLGLRIDENILHCV